MCAKSRKSVRYEILGKVEASELSTFPAKLLDISSQGCKIHYSNPVTVELDSEYTIKIKFTEQALSEQLTLICQPIWVCEESGATNIGMKFLHSPDTDTLLKYISFLHLESQSDNDVKSQIVESECHFI